MSSLCCCWKQGATSGADKSAHDVDANEMEEVEIVRGTEDDGGDADELAAYDFPNEEDQIPPYHKRRHVTLLEGNLISMVHREKWLRKETVSLINQLRLRHGSRPLKQRNSMINISRQLQKSYANPSDTEHAVDLGSTTHHCPNEDLTVGLTVCRMDDWESHEVPAKVVQFWYSGCSTYDYSKLAGSQQGSQERQFAQLIDDGSSGIGLSFGIPAGIEESHCPLCVIATYNNAVCAGGDSRISVRPAVLSLSQEAEADA